MREDEEINVRRSSHVWLRCLKTYRQRQDTIAVSSGESEFYGIVKVAKMEIGSKSMFKDLGLEVEVQVNTDSSAARSISSRRAAGRARHVEVHELWVQERVRSGELSIIKVRGENNVADGLAKHVDRSNMEMHMERGGFVRRGGRHEFCPYVGDV
jgi:hypothetical protein